MRDSQPAALDCGETGGETRDTAAQRGEPASCEPEGTDGASQHDSPHPRPQLEGVFVAVINSNQELKLLLTHEVSSEMLLPFNFSFFTLVERRAISASVIF